MKNSKFYLKAMCVSTLFFISSAALVSAAPAKKQEPASYEQSEGLSMEGTEPQEFAKVALTREALRCMYDKMIKFASYVGKSDLYFEMSKCLMPICHDRLGCVCDLWWVACGAIGKMNHKVGTNCFTAYDTSQCLGLATPVPSTGTAVPVGTPTAAPNPEP